MLYNLITTFKSW